MKSWLTTMSFLGGLLGLLTPALADEITSATWTPGTGATVALAASPAPPAAISTTSYGKFTFVATLTGTVEEVKVAFALQYDADYWYQSGATRYLTLRDEFITLTPQGTDTRMEAVVPAVHELWFVPNQAAPQTLRVWIGYPGTMIVDPVAGVVGASLAVSYEVETSVPTLTFVPPEESIVHGVETSRTLRCTLQRSTVATADDVYALSWSGTAGLLQAMPRLPETATIAAGQSCCIFFLDYDPIKSTALPGVNSNLSVTATSSFGTVATNIKFSRDLLMGWFEAQEKEDPPAEPMKQCSQHTDVYNVKAKEQIRCGPCGAHAWGVPDGGYGDGEAKKVWIVPYKCEAAGMRCDVTEKTFLGAESTMTSFTRDCRYKDKVKRKKADGTEEEVDGWVDGKQFCFRFTSTAGKANVKAKDCD